MRKLITNLAVVLALSGACFAQSPPQPVKAVQAEPEASADPRVKFKDGERYLRDLSAALEIPREEICRELGRYDCVNEAFRIVLGGVEAANLAVNTPLEDAALTAPIALDRVALNACTMRVKRDLADPKHAVLLRAGASSAGKPSSAWLKSTTGAIYGRILLRDPTAAEVKQMSAFYDEVHRGRKANDFAAASDWVTLGCFSVASSLENTFY